MHSHKDFYVSTFAEYFSDHILCILDESLFAWRRGVSSGLIVYLAALKKGTIWAAHPYYVIYR